MTSRYPEYDRSSFGYRPMLEKHEDLLSTAISENREIVGPIDDRSLGAILVARNHGDPVALMITPKASSGGSPTWCFAKGHPEENESDIDCAIREFFEETGVDTRDAIMPDIYMEEAYSFVSRLHRDRWEKHAAYPDESQRPISIAHKLVRYYLAVIDEPLAVSIQEDEVADAKWIPISEVLSRLSHAEGIDSFKRFFESAAVKAHISA